MDTKPNTITMGRGKLFINGKETQWSIVEAKITLGEHPIPIEEDKPTRPTVTVTIPTMAGP